LADFGLAREAPLGLKGRKQHRRQKNSQKHEPGSLFWRRYRMEEVARKGSHLNSILATGARWRRVWGRDMSNWWGGARRWIQGGAEPRTETRLGLALGGGFARGIAHVGVLRAFEKAKIPIHYISGVSAGSIVASAFASGSSTEEIE